jgi:hypothetical protein
MTKSSTNVDENDWTFGQILPAFLLLGPVATAIKASFEHQLNGASPQSYSNASTFETSSYGLANNEPTVIDALNDSNESLEMRCFRQHMANCVNRNYYDPKTCQWMPWVVLFACLQALTITLMMFAVLVIMSASVPRVLLSSGYFVLVVVPSAAYMLVITCIIYEIYGPTRGQFWMFTAFLISVSGVFVVYPLWEHLGYFFGFGGTSTTNMVTTCLFLTSGAIIAIAASGVFELLLFVGGKD